MIVQHALEAHAAGSLLGLVVRARKTRAFFQALNLQFSAESIVNRNALGTKNETLPVERFVAINPCSERV
jgi:hypothetical protein